MNILRQLRLCGTLVAFGFAASPSYAIDDINDWRSEVAQTRQMADNSAARAYDKALRLQRALPADADPSDQARILNLLARVEITLSQTDEAARHAQQALDLAKQHGDRVGQLEADLNIALNSVNQADIPALIASTTHSIEVLGGVDRPDLVGEAFLRTAMMYRRLGQIDESITMCMQAMDIAERTNDPLALLYAHQGLGLSYSQSNHYELAREHFTEMLNQARAIHSKLMEAYALTSLAGTIAQLGDHQGAEADFREAIGLYRSVGTPVGLNYGLFGLAAHLRNQGDNSAALSIFNEIMTIYARYPNRIGTWFTLNARSDVLETLGRTAEARADAEQASGIADSIGLVLYRTESRRRLAALAAATGDHRRAYQLSTEAAEITAQAAEEKISTRVIEMAQRYRSASEQREIDELTRRNQQQTESLRQHRIQLYWLVALLSVSAAALIGLSSLAVHLRRSQTQEMEAKLALEQQQAERRLLDEQLFETRRLQELGQLAGGIAHDFNNLLGAILGFTHFILQDSDDDNPVKGYAGHIRAAGLRGKGIIEKILSFAQGKEPSRGTFGLVDLVRETIELLRATIPATTHFILAAEEENAVVEADYDQIGQALLNLCINAHDALEGRPGTVTVAIRMEPIHERRRSARPRIASRIGAVEIWQDDAGDDWAGIGSLRAGRDYVFLAVSDNGAGMDGDLLKRIFTPFFSTKAKNRGTGLGLAVVRDVVLANDGAVTVRSRPGSGTCFTIAIPRGWEEEEAPGHSPDPVIEAGHCRILMVDDDPDFSAMMLDALDRRGIAVTFFASPREALEAVRKHPRVWDAVLTDYAMPEMSGTDLIGAIKAIDDELPCILCTGYIKDMTTQKMQEAGVAAVILKPGDIDDAVSRIIRIASSGGAAH